MDLATVVTMLTVVGVVLWAITRYIPMTSSIKNSLSMVVVIAVVLWLLQGFGVIDSIHNVKIK